MIVVVLALLFASPASAGPPGITKCDILKLLAAGRKAASILRCYAEADGSGRVVDAACVDRAAVKLLDIFIRLDTSGSCPTTGDGDTIETEVDRLIFYVRLELPSPAGVSHCSAMRLRATARLAMQLFALNAGDRRNPRPGLNDRETVARTRYLNAYAAAALKGDCPPGDTFTLDAVEGQMRVVIGRLFATCQDGIRAPSEECDINDAPTCFPLCNPDCTCPHCGDNLVNRPGEQCDGTADTACPGSCQADCTCPPPACGDGRVNQPSEQCDPPNDAACAGLCQPDCTCPAPVCGNLVVESGEQCEGTCPSPFGPQGCFPPGDTLECQCCATTSPCYDASIGFSIPCCPGTVCVIPTVHLPNLQAGCAPACATDADCTGGQICILGGCLGPFQPCSPGCAPLYVCDPQHNVCVPCIYAGFCF